MKKLLRLDKNYYVIIAFCLIINLRKQKAIDVYQGEITLEITYKDSIPIDSVVVWKNR